MRLVSKFRDYYDSLFRYSAGEKKDVFVRETKKVPEAHVTIPFNSYFSHGHYGYDVSAGLIGFCGKIYPFLRIIKTDKRTPYEDESKKIVFVYNYDSIQQHFPEFMEGLLKYSARWHNGDFTSLRSMEEWLTCADRPPRGQTLPYLQKLFNVHRCAYFCIERDGRYATRFTIYPILSEYQFYRKFDINQTFQEIDMYINNQLAKRDDPYIAPVSDKIKAESHGFDKFSFRKDKSSKKRKV